jgi:hypothetical protein
VRPEFKLFLTILLIGIVIPSLIFGFDFYLKEHIEIQLHDTYYIFAPFEFGLAVTAPIIFTVFLIKGLKNGFSQRLTNIFLCVGVILLLLVVIEIVEFLGSFNN